MTTENAFDVCRDCVPGDMLVTDSPSSENVDSPVLFQSPRLGRLSVSADAIRAVPIDAFAFVVARTRGYDDWAFVLCDGTLGWINALSVKGKVRSDGQAA